VDNPQRALNVAEAVNAIARDYPVVFSFHPRAKDKLVSTALSFILMSL